MRHLLARIASWRLVAAAGIVRSRRRPLQEKAGGRRQRVGRRAAERGEAGEDILAGGRGEALLGHPGVPRRLQPRTHLLAQRPPIRVPQQPNEPRPAPVRLPQQQAHRTRLPLRAPPRGLSSAEGIPEIHEVERDGAVSRVGDEGGVDCTAEERMLVVAIQRGADKDTDEALPNVFVGGIVPNRPAR